MAESIIAISGAATIERAAMVFCMAAPPKAIGIGCGMKMFTHQGCISGRPAPRSGCAVERVRVTPDQSSPVFCCTSPYWTRSMPPLFVSRRAS